MLCLREEVLIILDIPEVILRRGLGSQRLSGADELQVLKPACDSPVAVRVEGIEGYRGSSVDTRIHETLIEDRLARLIDDTGCSGAVGVDEPGIRVRLIIRSLDIAIAERCLDGRERRQGLAVSPELSCAVVVSGLDGLPDLRYSHLVALRDYERDAVLRCPAVDGGRLPYMAV